eukprot:886992-Rhodomonas_salina.4
MLPERAAAVLSQPPPPFQQGHFVRALLLLPLPSLDLSRLPDHMQLDMPQCCSLIVPEHPSLPPARRPSQDQTARTTARENRRHYASHNPPDMQLPPLVPCHATCAGQP